MISLDEALKKENMEARIQKKKNRMLSKIRNTYEHGISVVKEASDRRFWATNHEGCFKCTFGPGETKIHRDKKFERWVYHKTLGRKVFCELRLKTGRPDLTIVDKGFVFIEEIVVSEKEESISRKKLDYPFPINFVRVNK